ncbi:hypothetical protein AO353_21205 [Pseudomonas fluorescens]|uniref:Uncharacterized protein n=1 Tax=Pseudomonas fluorescens TaxID=294 RepID=A0A0N9WND1_PSEFL|nr:hypothetical protein AO353_21205 [Pseudomonas fluorescens]
MFQPYGIIISRQVLSFFSPKIWMTMMTISIPYRINLFNTNTACNILNSFDQKTSWAKAFEIFCQCSINVQRPVTLYAFVYPLNGTDKNT